MKIASEKVAVVPASEDDDVNRAKRTRCSSIAMA
jgi:hypothetical protein